MNIHFQGKGWVPSPCPPYPPASPCTVLVTLVTPWAECRSGGPTKRPLVSPHNSPWWWLTLLFMERAGGSYNTLQIIAHPRSPLYSPSRTPPPHIFFSLFLPLICLIYSHFLKPNLYIYKQSILLFTFFIFPFSVHPLRHDSESHGTHSQQTVTVVCEGSVLSKQTHWAICYSTLHHSGSSEESAHHFNQTQQHTMNL